MDFDIDRFLSWAVPRSRLYLLPDPVSWFMGYRSSPQRPLGNVLVWFWAFIGAVVGLLVVEAVFRTPHFRSEGAPLIIASLGATAILEYNTIDSPLAQPRNAFFGQIFSATIGIGITKLFHLNPDFENLRWIAGALAVGVSSVVMGFTKTVHPPAGATALLAATSPEISDLGWFLLPLVILGTSLMLAVACIVNNIQRRFPLYWMTPEDLSWNERPDIEKQISGRSVDEFAAYTGSRGPVITIDRMEIVVPDSISLDKEELSLLEAVRRKLEASLQSTNSKDTDETQV